LKLTQNDLIKLIHETKAVSIWNREKGPVFWYIAGVPGPYYVNTEMLIGAEAANKVLGEITSILSESKEPNIRGGRISAAVLGEYEKNSVLKDLVSSLLNKAKEKFPAGSFDFVSGGERRDWLFSVPFAKEAGVGHAFLFKDLSVYYAGELGKGERVLHIADLINNAASYLDLWLPALKKAGAECAGTLCVINRGSNGMKKLEEHGIKASSLCGIDLGFFEKSKESGLISEDTLAEIAIHFESPRNWAVRYLMGKDALFGMKTADKKSLKRMKSFFANDPWSLKPEYAEFFSSMQSSLSAGS